MKETWLESTLKRLSDREFDLNNFDFEMDSKSKGEIGEHGVLTLCGKLGRKHKMKRISAMMAYCIYPGCDGHC